MRTSTRRLLGGIRRRVARAGGRGFAPVGLAVEHWRALRTRAAIAAFNQRADHTRRFPEPRPPQAKPTVVAVVTHVADTTRPLDESVERVARTLDGIIESVGHADVELVLNTMPGRHVAADLPEHLRERLVVREHVIDDPLFLGFEAQEEFVRRADDADWFLYTEDDIVLGDALVLEKLRYFIEGAPAEAVLLPHRYELWQGRKHYIDLVSKQSPVLGPSNRLTVLDIGGWKFAEFENPHSGWYCLSREQLARWLATGRRWYGKVSFTAARESAATGCLAEAFRLYKPHPDNMTYLEVRHWDTKYAELRDRIHRQSSPA
jgi:hypothetical protein